MDILSLRKKRKKKKEKAKAVVFASISEIANVLNSNLNSEYKLKTELVTLLVVLAKTLYTCSKNKMTLSPW